MEDFIIEQEHVPAFRAALRAVADPLVAAAGEAGEVVFLDIKTFEGAKWCFVRTSPT